MKFDISHISNEIKDLLKENKYLPTILAVSVTATVTVGLILYFRKKNRVVRYARKFIGEDEISGNMGFANEQFEELMRKYGDFDKGQAWCMSFAKMVWLKKFGLKYRDDLDRLITPSTQQTWANFKNEGSGKYLVGEKPSKGAIVIWQRYVNGSGTYSGHAGIVQDFDNKQFETVEGNTNDAGGSEGYTVAEKIRPYAWGVDNGLRLKGFISIK
jgi:hypothetical protein